MRIIVEPRGPISNDEFERYIQTIEKVMTAIEFKNQGVTPMNVYIEGLTGQRIGCVHEFVFDMIDTQPIVQCKKCKETFYVEKGHLTL